MPTDTRRLPVPDISQSPLTFVTSVPKPVPLVGENGCRCDGRKADQVRPIFIKPGVVSQARGSAYMEMNQTKVICAVYGPREVTRREDFSLKGQLMCEFKFATFSCPLRRPHQQDSEMRDYSVVIQEALEPAVRLDKFPKARMDVYIMVIQNDGSALAASLSCASTALADAGVEMYDLVVGASLRLSGDHILLDPCRAEEYKSSDANSSSKNNGTISLGLMPSLHQVSALLQKGDLDLDTATKGLKVCVDTCQKIYPVLQQCLVKSVKNRLNTKTVQTV